MVRNKIGGRPVQYYEGIIVGELNDVWGQKYSVVLNLPFFVKKM